jgi:hypothetical protein
VLNIYQPCGEIKYNEIQETLARDAAEILQKEKKRSTV